MKKIVLITDERPFWATIKEHLKRVNAEVVTLDENQNREISPADKPDLVIIGSKNRMAASSLPELIPKLVIKAGLPPGVRLDDRGGGNLHIVGWPLEEEEFLELTSGLLSLSRRRVFRALIGIIPKGENTRYIGKSEDFSLTGLAFTVDRRLTIGQEVTISFFAAETMKSVKLKAEIVRRTERPSDGTTLYGARFADLGPAEKRTLGKFLWGKA